MRRFLVCGGVHSQLECLTLIEKTVTQRRPDAVLFAGGVLGPTRQYVDKTSPWGTRTTPCSSATSSECSDSSMSLARYSQPLDLPKEDFCD